jgi:hypothetical protein
MPEVTLPKPEVTKRVRERKDPQQVWNSLQTSGQPRLSIEAIQSEISQELIPLKEESSIKNDASLGKSLQQEFDLLKDNDDGIVVFLRELSRNSAVSKPESDQNTQKNNPEQPLDQVK